MNENLKFWVTLIVGLIGACAWAPFIYEKVQSNHFDGKIISIYNNITSDKKKTLLLFKLSVVSRNRDFFLKDISVNIKFSSSNDIICTSRNMRLIVFTDGTIQRKLNVPANQFLNNLSIFKKDTPEVGYLFIEIPYNTIEPFNMIEFIFNSYENKTKKLKFSGDEIKSEKLLFDDSIWSPVNINDPQYQRLLK